MARTIDKKNSNELIRRSEELKSDLNAIEESMQSLTDQTVTMVNQLMNSKALETSIERLIWRKSFSFQPTDEMNQLADRLQVYVECKSYADRAELLKGRYKDRIREDELRLTPALGTLSWLSASKNAKVAAERAFWDLHEIQEGEYGEIRRLHHQRHASKVFRQQTPRSARQDRGTRGTV